MKLRIYGPRPLHPLFIAHASDCTECSKLKPEEFSLEEDFISKADVSACMFEDMINDRTMTVASGLEHIQFKPCCASLPLRRGLTQS